MYNDSVRRKLNALLDANARFDIAARGTTNHCPMALVALAEMGASATRLQAFFDRWEREYALSAPPIDMIIPREKWAMHLGKPSAFGALRVCFQDWMADVGHVAVITATLSAVPFAPATLAFHALIRLAYGIEARHMGEIASGLAALIASHLPIEHRANRSRSAGDVAAGLHHVANALRGATLPADSITSRLRAVASDARFAEAVVSAPTHIALLDDLARATIDIYWRRPDFTALHMVTATHAARIVFSQLDDTLTQQSLPNLWIALCAAYASVGGAELHPHADLAIPCRNMEWHDVWQRAVTSDDEHVIKMAYTCFCEDRRDPSPLYLASAARLLL